MKQKKGRTNNETVDKMFAHWLYFAQGISVDTLNPLNFSKIMPWTAAKFLFYNIRFIVDVIRCNYMRTKKLFKKETYV